MDPNDIHIDPRWAEYDMGDLSGQFMDGVTPAQRVSAPNAEDPQVFQARIQAALHDAVAFKENVLVVSHAGVGRMIEATKQGLDPARFYELDGYPNAQIVRLEVE